MDGIEMELNSPKELRKPQEDPYRSKTLDYLRELNADFAEELGNLEDRDKEDFDSLLNLNGFEWTNLKVDAEEIPQVKEALEKWLGAKDENERKKLGKDFMKLLG